MRRKVFERLGAKRMNETQKGWLQFLSGIAFIIVVLFSLFWVTKGEASSASKFIYDYQTLITGIAAVFAAGYTVRQMRITDEMSEKRHRELVSLQLRADRLRVERLLFPALGDLEDALKKVSNFNLSVVQKILDDEPDNARLLIESLERECFEVLSILGNSQFKAAEDLFDGDLALRYSVTYDQLMELEGGCKAWISDFSSRAAAYRANNIRNVELFTELLKKSLDEMKPLKSSLQVAFADLNVCLEAMKKEYRVHL